MRIGQGVDVHRFSDRPERRLVLGGVAITEDDAQGLEGHSDADAVAHAIADAVLGAAGLGDLGRHAPDTDPAMGGCGQPGDPGTDGPARPGGGVDAGQRRLHRGRRTASPRPLSSTAMAGRLGSVLGVPCQREGHQGRGTRARSGRSEGIGCTAVVLMAALPGGPWRPTEVGTPEGMPDEPGGAKRGQAAGRRGSAAGAGPGGGGATPTGGREGPASRAGLGGGDGAGRERRGQGARAGRAGGNRSAGSRAGGGRSPVPGSKARGARGAPDRFAGGPAGRRVSRVTGWEGSRSRAARPCASCSAPIAGP
jgi:2-C-methyl-D-erythritol 2,4-cyclodiphosphate synthase